MPAEPGKLQPYLGLRELARSYDLATESTHWRRVGGSMYPAIHTEGTVAVS